MPEKMSSSPNQMQSSPPIQMQSSPPSSVTANELSTKVVVPMPVIQQQDEIFYYVFVKGSLYSPDSAVFGLEAQEIQAIAKKFNSPCKEIENGIMFKRSVVEVINALAQLGYRVISTCGETESMFTLQREL